MLALIAGQGRLPVLLARRLTADRVAFRVYELLGQPFDNPDALPVTGFRIEHLGSLIDRLVGEGTERVCFAGSIRRPNIDPDQIDAATRPLSDALTRAISLGDDGALRVVVSLFEARGLSISSATTIMPELLPSAGVATARQPEARHMDDARLGWDVLDQQGQRDLGQACVISQGQVVTREGAAGTDAMLAGLSRQSGGFLFKGPKPDQDRRVDLPTIGVGTVSAVARAGLDGIIIAAGGVLVLDLGDVLAACDRAGLFLSVQERP